MTVSENKRKIGIIYLRWSSKSQVENENTIGYTVDKLTETAHKLNVPLPYDPVIDVVSTKEHISKKLEEILELAKNRKITHLLVERLDRIGRSPIESMYFIYILRGMGVKIITLNGEVDINEFKDLCVTVLECFSAAMEIRNLSDRTQGGRKRNFQNGSWNKPVPIGYKKDGNWISKKLHYEPVIKEVHVLYQNGESKSKIQKHINVKYNNILDVPLKYHHIDPILKDCVYIGKPSYKDVVVEDPNLQFIDEEVFNKTKKLLEEESKREVKTDKTINIEDLVKDYGLHYTTKHLPVAVLCDECGKPMVTSNGLREINGIYRNNYLCECGKQRTVPTAHQLDHFYSADPLYCPNCGTPDEFKEEKVGERFRVTCKICRYVFDTNRSTNKFLRRIRRAKRNKKDKRKIVFDDSLRQLSDFFEVKK